MKKETIYRVEGTGHAVALIATCLIAHVPCSDPCVSPYGLTVSLRAYAHGFAAIASYHPSVSRIASLSRFTSRLASLLILWLASRLAPISCLAPVPFLALHRLVYRLKPACSLPVSFEALLLTTITFAAAHSF